MLDRMRAGAALIPKIFFVEGRDEVTNVSVEVALTYNDSYSEHIYSYVNINTIEGGTHVAGFRGPLRGSSSPMATSRGFLKRRSRDRRR